MMTTATTETIKHGCGHSWIWQFSADFTPAEIKSAKREYYAQCPDCRPQAWFSNPRYETRPIERVASAAPVAAAAVPAASAALVVSAQPARRLATTKQLDYLARLGVVVPADRQLTIEDASAAIDEARRGGSVGWLGLFYEDGGN